MFLPHWGQRARSDLGRDLVAEPQRIPGDAERKSGAPAVMSPQPLQALRIVAPTHAREVFGV